MRTPAVLGASLLLVVGLAAGPASALSAGHGDRGDWEGSGDPRMGSSWDGGSGWADGERFSWPDDTRSWDDNVCPDMDEPKTDVDGEKQTITLKAPEGQLISAYCVKAGSAKRGEGPKLVELDEPVEEVTIAYPTGGKCRAISHYAVAYVAAPTPVTTTEPPTEGPTTAPPSEEPATDQPGTDEPGTDQPGTDQPGTDQPGTDQPGTDETEPSTEPSTLPTEPTDGSTPGMGGADYVDDESEVVETGSQPLGGAPGRVSADRDAVAAPETLPVTGAQVLGMVMAAVALVGAGVGALIWTRQRRAS